MGTRRGWGILLVFLACCYTAWAASFGCEIRSSCLSNQTLLIRLNSSDPAESPNNTHGQLANYSGDLYPHSVCCWTDAFRTLTNTCSASSTRVLGLDSTTDSHLQAGSNTSYAYSACLNVTAGSIACEYPNSACSATYDGVLSISSSNVDDDNLTNAHAAEFGEYLRKACCRVSGQNPPTVASATISPINTTTRLDLVCNNGSVSDGDSDNVTLHYNWFQNDTSITVGNFPMAYDSDTATTHDISGFANHGAVTGATLLPLGGAIGGGFQFDGVDDCIDAGNGAEFQITGNMTVSIWARPLLVAAQTAIFVEKDDTREFALGYVPPNAGGGTANRLSWLHGNGTHNEQINFSTLTNDTWQHLVVVRDAAAQRLYGYKDGSLTHNISYTRPLVVGTSDLHMGCRDGTDFNYSGVLDEVLIFNRSLSPEEVLTLYTGHNQHLNSTELVRTEGWNCSITPVDASGLNGTTVYSTETLVTGTPPLAVTLLHPRDGNATVFERYVNLSWTDADERDGDAVTYRLNLSVAAGTCAVEREFTGLTTSNRSVGELCYDQLYVWNVTACDTDGCASISSTFNFTIASVLGASITNPTIAFGSLANLESQTTDDYSPIPFLIENTGNVFANVSVNGSVAPFSSVALGNTAYQFRVANNESSSINTSVSQVTYTPVQASYILAIHDINYTDTSDLAAMHINVTVPANEPPGAKSGNLTIQSVVSS